MLLVEMLLRSFRTCKDVNVILLPVVYLNSLSFHIFSQRKLKQAYSMWTYQNLGQLSIPFPFNSIILWQCRTYPAVPFQNLHSPRPHRRNCWAFVPKKCHFAMEKTWKIQRENPTHNKTTDTIYGHLAPWFDPPMLSMKNAPFPRWRLFRWDRFDQQTDAPKSSKKTCQVDRIFLSKHDSDIQFSMCNGYDSQLKRMCFSNAKKTFQKCHDLPGTQKIDPMYRCLYYNLSFRNSKRNVMFADQKLIKIWDVWLWADVQQEFELVAGKKLYGIPWSHQFCHGCPPQPGAKRPTNFV